MVGGKAVASQKFAADVKEAIELSIADVENVLKPGDNDVEIEVTGKNQFPYTLAWTYNTIRPLAEARANVPSHATPDHASVTRMITTLSDLWLAARCA